MGSQYHILAVFSMAVSLKATSPHRQSLRLHRRQRDGFQIALLTVLLQFVGMFAQHLFPVRAHMRVQLVLRDYPSLLFVWPVTYEEAVIW
jgi:hypothetical protein